MKLFKFLNGKLKKKEKRVSDFYQDSIEKFGREEIKKLVEQGLNFKVIVL